MGWERSKEYLQEGGEKGARRATKKLNEDVCKWVKRESGGENGRNEERKEERASQRILIPPVAPVFPPRCPLAISPSSPAATPSLPFETGRASQIFQNCEDKATGERSQRSVLRRVSRFAAPSPARGKAAG